MFKSCPSRKARLGLLLYLSNFLKENADGFGIPDKNLRPTEPVWIEARTPVLDAKTSNFLAVCGKPLPKDKKIVFVADYKDAQGNWRPVPHPHNDAGGIFDFRSWRTFCAADYPPYPPGEQDEIPQMIIGDRQPEPEKYEILSAPIAHPNRNEDKIALIGGEPE
jgi:hypothetical protein